MEEIRKRVIDILYDIYQIDKEIIDKTDDLLQLNINSKMFIQLVVAIETEFNITYPDDMLDIRAIVSITKLVEMIDSILNGDK